MLRYQGNNHICVDFCLFGMAVFITKHISSVSHWLCLHGTHTHTPPERSIQEKKKIRQVTWYCVSVTIVYTLPYELAYITN